MLLAAACSATPTPRGLARAEALERAGRDGEAARAYDEAAGALCDGTRDRSRWCAAALRGGAAARARSGQPEAAAAAYERIPASLPGLPDEQAAAMVAAAGLHLELGHDERAYDLYWRVLVEHPESAAAEDALRAVVADGRRRDARQLYGVLRDLYARLHGTAVGDNLLWSMAALAREELHEPAAALEACDRLVVAHPESPLRDDAAWQGALLARAAGDAEGAARRLRALLETRERSLVVGSYHSVHLDDAQLLLGVILRDELRRPRDAAGELRKLPRHYPESVLRDDALYELAITHQALGERAHACRALAELPGESKYRLEKAPSLMRALGC